MFEDTDTEQNVHCSFCGKSQDEVKKIVAGPGVYICNECVELCQQIIDQELAGLLKFQHQQKLWLNLTIT